MRRLFAGLIFLVSGLGLAADEGTVTLPGAADVPPLLYDALAKVAQDFDRWAFTETRRSTDEHGVPKPETVVRFDPSQPYAEQFVPLKVNGKPPTARQLKSYRTRGVKRGEKYAKQEAEGKVPAPNFRASTSMAVPRPSTSRGPRWPARTPPRSLSKCRSRMTDAAPFPWKNFS